MNDKYCRKCDNMKSCSEFPRNRNTRDGLASQCKDCTRRANALHRLNHPNRIRDTAFRTKYGITVVAYNTLHEKQGGLCAICHEPESTGRRLAVDHNHGTGKVRGLLCFKCNTALGKLNDSPERCEAAAKYLRVGG